ncbi:MAG: NAD(P)H-hydrate epimerase [Planctomycetes bacterium]|nr:NAD(P)H-hydrate epimerase [Planctomycetota bacterium]
MSPPTYSFQLPEIVEAERCGRAIIEAHPPRKGEAWIALVDASFAGAAALAAVRLAHTCGAAVTIYLLSPQADTCSSFSTMLEVAGSMDLPVCMWENKLAEKLPANKRVLLACNAPELGSLFPDAIRVDDFESSLAWQTVPPGAIPEAMLHVLTPATPALCCAAVRELDRATIEDYGLPGICLMENAGIGATAVALEMLAGNKNQKTLILAGRGNNGGDGYVVARGLLEMGYPVTIALLSNPEGLRGDALSNYTILTDAGVEVEAVPDNPERIAELLAGRDLVIDAIFGTGIKGKLTGMARSTVEAVNASGLPVLALDIPSGLNGDTGEVLGVAVKATRTVTFAAVKEGLIKGQGSEHCGGITLADIGAPRELLKM